MNYIFYFKSCNLLNRNIVLNGQFGHIYSRKRVFLIHALNSAMSDILFGFVFSFQKLFTVLFGSNLDVASMPSITPRVSASQLVVSGGLAASNIISSIISIYLRAFA